MGEVLRVHDRTLHRTVAMKVLREDVSTSSGTRRRFAQEAHATAQLQHPGIVPVHDVGVLDDGRLYFTMREVRGQTLREALPDQNLWQAVEIFRRVCDAVAYAHDRGVLHRDLKPDNIMIGSFGDVLVLDWGLVKLGDTELEPVITERIGETMHGSIAGTPAYMAPEQARGDEVSTRSDVYALGTILYEIIAGEPAFSGPTQSILAAVRTGTTPRRLSAGPAELVDVVQRAMASEPSDRFTDAAAVGQHVAAWLDGSLRRRLALEQVAASDALLPGMVASRARAIELDAEADAFLSEVPDWAPEVERQPGWAKRDRAAALRIEVDLAILEAQRLLHAALAHAPDLTEAHSRLADGYRKDHARAEQVRNLTDMARFEMLLRTHAEALAEDDPDRLRHANYLAGAGALTLHTEPPGAQASLYRYVLHERRLVTQAEGELGVTPLDHVPLPMGSYLVELKAPGHATVRYPVSIGREEHWDGIPPGGQAPLPIRLPRQDELGPDDCYVPAGWFIAGGDPKAPGSLPRQRLWADATVFRRFPVTVGGYLDYLNTLVASGREEEAARVEPREFEGERGGVGRPVFARSNGLYELVPDVDGDIWDRDWPILLVEWDAAAAYCAFVSAADGLDWRLSGELEWEKAARGVDARLYPWGDHFDPTRANALKTRKAHPLPAVVDSFPLDVSPYGIRGMGGNSRDWCADHYRREGPELDGPRVLVPKQQLPDGISSPRAPSRAQRGGSWGYDPTAVRLAKRSWAEARGTATGVGFRLMRSYD